MVGLFSALVLLCTHIFNISTSDFNAKLTAMEHILKVLSYHGQIDAQISTNSCQICPKDPKEHKEKLQAPCYSKFSRKDMIRIIFKTLLITFKAIHGKAPVYIQELLEMKSSSQTYYRLRSSQDQSLLKYPSGKSKITLGDRAFMYAAPKLWNNLPLSVRKSATVNEFKTRLKTHLLINAM